jgi:hypothetical protein
VRHRRNGNNPGNLIVGVHLDGNANNNLIRGNLIGTDESGTASLGNAGPGVILVGGAANNVIGGPDPAAARNTIAFNAGPGIIVGSDAGSGNYLRFTGSTDQVWASPGFRRWPTAKHGRCGYRTERPQNTRCHQRDS